MAERQVRVLVANSPRLMREIVLAVLADQPDIDVIGEVQDNSELAKAVEGAHPDLLIIALDDIETRMDECRSLIRQHPQMKILALAPEKNRGLFCWGSVDVQTKAVESSEAGLLSAVRECATIDGYLQPNSAI